MLKSLKTHIVVITLFFFFLWDWDEFLVMCFRHNSNVIVMVSWQGKLQDLQT